MSHKVKILLTEFVTHDVKRFILEKPEGFKFIPGQAVDVSINKSGWESNLHPFTFTGLNNDLVLEFTIKGYPKSEHPDHDGMTELLHQLNPGDELLLGEVFGTINYKGNGTFIAAGAGITPFIAIIRQLKKDNKIENNNLIFANKTSQDIILEKELRDAFPNARFVLSREEKDGYDYGHIDKEYLKKHLNQNFYGEAASFAYLCGPKKFVASLKETLASLGASTDTLVFEE